MRIPRVYISGVLAEGAERILSDAQSHYLSKVLRMEAGRPLIAFNGDNWEYQATLVSTNKRNAAIQINEGHEVSRESSLYTHLAVGISRGERMDLVLQKATELGVSEITPLFTERSEVKLKGERLEKKMAHWRQITISACEQCQRNTLPILNAATPVSDFYQNHQASRKLVLHHRSEHRLKELSPSAEVTLLVGPEGGLSDAEIQQALNHHQYQALTLGPRVMRTETAPIAALTAVQLLWGDLS